MDFDHRDPSNKRYEISYLVNKTTCPWSRILDEIAKCDVVCVRCHRMRTWRPPKKSLDNRRKLIIALKTVPCADCGGSFHYCQMDFDHVRGEKVREVSLLKNLAIILAEAAKCDVVCANCHRERSHKTARGAQRLNPEQVDMAWQRRQEGTPQSLLIRPTMKAVPSPRSWHALVGTMPDKHVATQAGVTPSNVHYFRKKMGIPKFQSNQMKTETFR
jgi:hypothetical protein